jgi:hypothetical protein
MSWVAHDLEPYVFQRKLRKGAGISFVAVLLGSLGPGFIWDAFWIVALLLSWRVMRRSYFHERVAPRDGFWAWSGRLLPEHALVALYRHHPFDQTWGGPHWAVASR